jgi:hypothetical protein
MTVVCERDIQEPRDHHDDDQREANDDPPQRVVRRAR